MAEGNRFQRIVKQVKNNLPTRRKKAKRKTALASTGPVDFMGDIRKIQPDSEDYFQMFLDIPAVRGAVNAIVNATTGSGYSIKTIEGQDVETDNPKVRLISQWLEFPQKDFFSVVRTITTNLIVVDDSFTEAVINNLEKNKFGWMYPLDSRYTRFHLTKDKKEISHLTYQVGAEFGQTGTRLDPPNFVHASMNKLGSSLYGMSSLESLVNVSNLYNYTLGYNTALFEGGGVPAVTYIMKTGNERDFDRMVEMLENTKAGKNLGLFGDVDIHEIGISTKDMDFKGLVDHLVQMVMTVFQVPPVMMSMQGASSKETSKSEINSFGGVIRAVQRMVNNIITQIIHKIWGPEYEDVRFVLKPWNDPESQAAIYKIYLTTAVMTPNDVRKELDLPKVEWGDKPFYANFPAEESGVLPPEPAGGAAGAAPTASSGSSPSGNTDRSRPSGRGDRPKKGYELALDELNLMKIAQLMVKQHAKIYEEETASS